MQQNSGRPLHVSSSKFSSQAMFQVSTKRSMPLAFEHTILCADLKFHWSCECEWHSKGHLLNAICWSGKYWMQAKSSPGSIPWHYHRWTEPNRSLQWWPVCQQFQIQFLSLLLEISWGHCALICWWLSGFTSGFIVMVHSKNRCQTAMLGRLLYLQQANK